MSSKLITKDAISAQTYWQTLRTGELGLGPKVASYNATRHTMISAFLPGSCLTTESLMQPHISQAVVSYLKQLHRHQPATDHVSSVILDIQRFSDGISERLISFKHKMVFASLFDELRNCQLTPTLIHGDCHVGNMIYHNNAITMIDWDFAGWGDPLADLANIVTVLPEPYQWWYFRQYAPTASPETAYRFHILVTLHYLLYATWCLKQMPYTDVLPTTKLTLTELTLNAPDYNHPNRLPYIAASALNAYDTYKDNVLR